MKRLRNIKLKSTNEQARKTNKKNLILLLLSSPEDFSIDFCLFGREWKRGGKEEGTDWKREKEREKKGERLVVSCTYPHWDQSQTYNTGMWLDRELNP